MQEKLIIDKHYYKKLYALLKSNNQKNKELAVNIIDNCNIQESLKYVLCLINVGHHSKTRGGSLIFEKDNVWNYIDSLLEDDIPAFHDLNMLITAYENHCTDNRILPSARDIKFIAVEYKQYDPTGITEPLNPKKNKHVKPYKHKCANPFSSGRLKQNRNIRDKAKGRDNS